MTSSLRTTKVKPNLMSREYLQVYFLMFIMFLNGVLATLLFLLITSEKGLCLQLLMVLNSCLLIPQIFCKPLIQRNLRGLLQA